MTENMSPELDLSILDLATPAAIDADKTTSQEPAKKAVDLSSIVKSDLKNVDQFTKPVERKKVKAKLKLKSDYFAQGLSALEPCYEDKLGFSDLIVDVLSLSEIRLSLSNSHAFVQTIIPVNVEIEDQSQVPFEFLVNFKSFQRVINTLKQEGDIEVDVDTTTQELKISDSTSELNISLSDNQISTFDWQKQSEYKEKINSQSLLNITSYLKSFNSSDKEVVESNYYIEAGQAVGGSGVSFGSVTSKELFNVPADSEFFKTYRLGLKVDTINTLNAVLKRFQPDTALFDRPGFLELYDGLVRMGVQTLQSDNSEIYKKFANENKPSYRLKIADKNNLIYELKKLISIDGNQNAFVKLKLRNTETESFLDLEYTSVTKKVSRSTVKVPVVDLLNGANKMDFEFLLSFSQLLLILGCFDSHSLHLYVYGTESDGKFNTAVASVVTEGVNGEEIYKSFIATASV